MYFAIEFPAHSHFPCADHCFKLQPEHKWATYSWQFPSYGKKHNFY